ncbi:NAD(P)H-binding protein [Mycolicibacterium litorale]|uniref:NAD(P)H-binding protein n=1 Tax=Mycolicibacterium litorale TaxID=758802 RepID=UPI003CF31657
MSTERTLVLGATGKTGRRVVARLRLHRMPVRPASRSSETPFDWSQPDGWDAVLRDVDSVYLVPPAVPGPVHDFVARVHAAGVRRVVLLSGRGADTWGDSTFGMDMRDAEDAVRRSSLEWTILRANNFDQNFDEELFHAPVVSGELALPAGDVPEPFIDIEDVADVAATVLTEPGRHAGETYELSGPRPITFREAVDMIGRVTGRDITYKQISAAEYAAALVEDGFGEDDARHLADMYAVMERGLIASTTDGVATVLGRAPRTFEDYVLRTAAKGAWDR